MMRIRESQGKGSHLHKWLLQDCIPQQQVAAQHQLAHCLPPLLCHASLSHRRRIPQPGGGCTRYLITCMCTTSSFLF